MVHGNGTFQIETWTFQLSNVVEFFDINFGSVISPINLRLNFNINVDIILVFLSNCKIQLKCLRSSSIIYSIDNLPVPIETHKPKTME